MTSVNVPEKMNPNYWVRPTTAATAPAVIVNPREAAMVCLDTASEPAYVSRTFVLDTIGNATLIGYDGVPMLVTDPWIEGSPYFGSWTLSHEIPEEQRAAIRACPYVWFSHGHPDHLNAESLPLFRDRVILLPDHVGRRIQNELERGGFTIEVLPDRTWRHLSPRLRVLCISDYNQ